jgi:hypothetical protein
MNNIQEYNYYFRTSDNTLFKKGDEVKTKIDGAILGRIERIYEMDKEVRINIYDENQKCTRVVAYILYKPYRKNTIEKVK